MLNLFLLINESLLPLNVLKHVFALRQHEVVGEHFRVLFVKLHDFGQTLLGFLESVPTFQELTHIVVDQVIFEDGNEACRFIIDDVIDDLSVIVLSRGHVFGVQALRYQWVLDSI